MMDRRAFITADADYLSTWYPRRAEERRSYLERLGQSSPFWLETPDAGAARPMASMMTGRGRRAEKEKP